MIEYIIVGVVAGVTSNVLTSLVVSKIMTPKSIPRKSYGFNAEKPEAELEKAFARKEEL